MTAGQTVMIYTKPMTQEEPEGEACLMEVCQDTGDGYPLWYVEFADEPGERYVRTVKEA